MNEFESHIAECYLGNSKFRSDYYFLTQDKEWFIDGLGVNNICDLMTYVESDDIRDAGIIFTLPLFIPYIYVIAYRKQRSFWQLLTVTVLVCFWLWRFFLRYQFCL